ncbi:hypothetical protein Agub_g15600, partial [Astrephomene gubernaculifera]
MGCMTSCMSPKVAELDKSLKTGDERAALLKLAACPKLLSSTAVLSSAGVTPLHVACQSKQVKLVQHIVAFLHCSELDVVRQALLPYCRRAAVPLPGCVTEGVRMAVDLPNAKGQTPLMYACFADCPELVKMLLEEGADPWVGDRCGGRTPLHYAAMSGSGGCIDTLLRHLPPASLSRQGTRYVNAPSRCGLTPLHYAVYFGRLGAMRALLEQDAALNTPSGAESYDVGVRAGRTCEAGSAPLHFAAVRGDVAAARELLRGYSQRLSWG